MPEARVVGLQPLGQLKRESSAGAAGVGIGNLDPVLAHALRELEERLLQRGTILLREPLGRRRSTRGSAQTAAAGLLGLLERVGVAADVGRDDEAAVLVGIGEVDAVRAHTLRELERRLLRVLLCRAGICARVTPGAVERGDVAVAPAAAGGEGE